MIRRHAPQICEAFGISFRSGGWLHLAFRIAGLVLIRTRSSKGLGPQDTAGAFAQLTQEAPLLLLAKPLRTPVLSGFVGSSSKAPPCVARSTELAPSGEEACCPWLAAKATGCDA